ncbi:MAG: hypothetical protein JXB88_10930 [Spirochaetales bacterium]|nr:hypothetical protein [Spirochaetales bacterium]
MECVALLKNIVSNGETHTSLALLNDYIDHIDNCLLTGFSNLSGDQLDRLKSLIRIFNNTPLEEKLADSMDSLINNIFSQKLFLSIAVIRNILLTLKYNLLVSSCKENPTGNSGEIAFDGELLKQDDSSSVQDTISNWLTELAITGFNNIVEEKLVGIVKAIPVLVRNKELTGQTALITGFVDDLFRNCISDAAAIPLTRWSDLWMKAFVNTRMDAITVKTRKISGTLFLVGLDLKTNVNLAQVKFYGILECGSQNNFVRIHRTNFKVDLIQDEEIWYLFQNSKNILSHYCRNKSILCKDIVLTENNDLLLDEDDIKTGKSFDLLKKLKEHFTESSSITGERKRNMTGCHPVFIEKPFFLEKIRIKKQDNQLFIALPDFTVPVAMNKIDSSSLVNEKSLKSAQSVFGLLRYDAETWQFQPMVYTTGKEPDKCIFNFSASAEEIEKITAKSTLAILRERASRLLRG